MNTSRTIALLSIGLTLSLCLNGFFVGTRVARYQAERHGPPPMHEVDDRSSEGRFGNFRDRPAGDRMRMVMKKFMERIPDEEKGPMQKAMEEARPVIEERMKAVDVARTAVHDLIKAETLDTARLQEALAAQRAAQSNVQAAVHDSIVKAMEGMSAEQRVRLTTFAKRLFM